jgi:hypothetical protein
MVAYSRLCNNLAVRMRIFFKYQLSITSIQFLGSGPSSLENGDVLAQVKGVCLPPVLRSERDRFWDRGFAQILPRVWGDLRQSITAEWRNYHLLNLNPANSLLIIESLAERSTPILNSITTALQMCLRRPPPVFGNGQPFLLVASHSLQDMRKFGLSDPAETPDTKDLQPASYA